MTKAIQTTGAVFIEAHYEKLVKSKVFMNLLDEAALYENEINEDDGEDDLDDHFWRLYNDFCAVMCEVSRLLKAKYAYHAPSEAIYGLFAEFLLADLPSKLFLDPERVLDNETLEFMRQLDEVDLHGALYLGRHVINGKAACRDFGSDALCAVDIPGSLESHLFRIEPWTED